MILWRDLYFHDAKIKRYFTFTTKATVEGKSLSTDTLNGAYYSFGSIDVDFYFNGYIRIVFISSAEKLQREILDIKEKIDQLILSSKALEFEGNIEIQKIIVWQIRVGNNLVRKAEHKLARIEAKSIFDNFNCDSELLMQSLKREGIIIFKSNEYFLAKKISYVFMAQLAMFLDDRELIKVRQSSTVKRYEYIGMLFFNLFNYQPKRKNDLYQDFRKVVIKDIPKKNIEIFKSIINSSTKRHLV